MAQKKKNKYRSGFESLLAEQLERRGVSYKYETTKIEWEDLQYRNYTPDFILPNNIIIEAKGRFTSSDRRKHLKIKAQHPTLDIRFVFQAANRYLYKGSKTTYEDWCIKNGFMFAIGSIPDAWIGDKKRRSKLPKRITYKDKKG